MRDRRAKLQQGVRFLKFGRRSYYPMLTLRGQWLHDAGFEAGMSVTIEVRSGELVIRPA
ncbi:MAG TPA: SymE family type I addiction module toxin [Bacteroidales bacterium]|nr:SymE family type I addiction module toxin [Bacteroidales bacterium]